MAASFVVYIDESGDEGFSFQAGSSRWFVLSAVITRKDSDVAAVKLVDQVRAQLGRPERKPLHFRDLRHEHRLPFVDSISQAQLRTVTVLVHKPSLREPERFQERYRLYFYGVRYLLERVSWFCRDHRRPHDVGDGTTDMVFSNRSAMSYDELREYLAYLETKTGQFDVRIEWSTIRPGRITAASAGSRMGLQIADAVAGSFFYAVEPSSHGFTEDRYARMLRPVVYQHHKDGRHLGYGLKFWPKEADVVVSQDPHLAWFRETYK